MRTTEFFSKLKEQNLSRLETKTGLSRQSLHNALNTHNMKLENLVPLAKAMNLELRFESVKSEDNILASLAKFGVPVAHSKDGNLSFEELVKESVLRSRVDGAYETFVPFLLAQHADDFDPLKVAAQGYASGQVNALGYFAEMANQFKPSSNLNRLLELLRVAKINQDEFLVTTNKTYFPELFEKNKVARQWNLKVRGTVEDHMERWEKWERSRKTN